MALDRKNVAFVPAVGIISRACGLGEVRSGERGMVSSASFLSSSSASSINLRGVSSQGTDDWPELYETRRYSEYGSGAVSRSSTTPLDMLLSMQDVDRDLDYADCMKSVRSSPCLSGMDVPASLGMKKSRSFESGLNNLAATTGPERGLDPKSRRLRTTSPSPVSFLASCLSPTMQSPTLLSPSMRPAVMTVPSPAGGPANPALRSWPVMEPLGPSAFRPHPVPHDPQSIVCFRGTDENQPRTLPVFEFIDEQPMRPAVRNANAAGLPPRPPAPLPLELPHPTIVQTTMLTTLWSMWPYIQVIVLGLKLVTNLLEASTGAAPNFADAMHLFSSLLSSSSSVTPLDIDLASLDAAASLAGSHAAIHALALDPAHHASHHALYHASHHVTNVSHGHAAGMHHAVPAPAKSMMEVIDNVEVGEPEAKKKAKDHEQDTQSDVAQRSEIIFDCHE